MNAQDVEKIKSEAQTVIDSINAGLMDQAEWKTIEANSELFDDELIPALYSLMNGNGDYADSQAISMLNEVMSFKPKLTVIAMGGSNWSISLAGSDMGVHVFDGESYNAAEDWCLDQDSNIDDFDVIA